MGDRPTVRLRVVDPDGVAARVAAEAGVEFGEDRRTITLANAIVAFEPMGRGGPGPTVAVEPMDRGGPGPTVAPDGAPIAGTTASVDAIGWATVDLPRAARELASDESIAPEGSKTPDLRLPARDARLGARVLRVGRPSSLPFDVVLLEPDTEGPLAAALARHGEGPAVVYVRAAFRGGQDETHITGSRFGPWVVVRGPLSTDDRV